jgi:hypothetical protein
MPRRAISSHRFRCWVHDQESLQAYRLATQKIRSTSVALSGFDNAAAQGQEREEPAQGRPGIGDMQEQGV